MPDANIREFYAQKNIFITGGSGFIGKVLIEKLLRSCPDLGNIYMLLRAKKGKGLEERVKAITDLPLFDLLKSQNPAALKKIKPIQGDVCKIGLGLSEEDTQTLINDVDILYHGAASVRFDDSLNDAIIMNTRGTREVALLAQKMKNLLVMVHISTAYCHTDREVIDECLYPAHADWREAIKVAESLDSYTLDVLSAKYLDKQPNTYTFTKSLSEHVANDLCKEKNIPLVILRPSIVISSWKEPVPGWIDNFNGPVGIFIGAGKGVLRSLYTDAELTSDYLPVDLIVKGLVIAAWVKALEKDPEKKLDVSVYNATNNEVEPVPLKDIMAMGETLQDEYPLTSILWYPSVTVTKCRYNHFLKLVFYHILPALVVDGILKIMGRKTILLRVQRKIYIANMALGYFITRQWKFLNFNAQKLEFYLHEEDVKDFGFQKNTIDVFDYFKNCMIGGMKYLIKQDITELEKAKVNMKRMYILSRVFNFLWYSAFFYILYYKFDILGVLSKCLINVYTYLTTD